MWFFVWIIAFWFKVRERVSTWSATRRASTIARTQKHSLTNTHTRVAKHTIRQHTLSRPHERKQRNMATRERRKKKRVSAINIILILYSLSQNYCNGFELYVPFKIQFIWFARMLHNMIWIYALWAREWILFFYFYNTYATYFFSLLLFAILPTLHLSM